MREVYIVSAARTPMGSYGGVFSEVPATVLGAEAIKQAISRAGLKDNHVDEVFMGSVLQANMGQAPAKQVTINSGLGDRVPCTTVNKVCASGMKAIIMGAQSILAGDNEVVLCGGMENMSRVPYYLEKARFGYKLGDSKLIDGLVKDGLTDAFKPEHMGVWAELCASECNISREDQDNYAIESYKRAAAAWAQGKFTPEIAPITIAGKKGDVIISEDEEYKSVNFEKIPTLRPVFKKDGTVTAANASTLNDGAAALVLVSGEQVKAQGLKPLAKIVSYADAAQAPEWFTTAPSKAIPKALSKAGLTLADIDFFEINEAFSVVSLANNREMKLDPAKVNVYGGAVALGHPIGCSGARIIVTLLNVMNQEGGKLGVAGICNGGGGASAMVVELC